jgi:hypothetical protein
MLILFGGRTTHASNFVSGIDIEARADVPKTLDFGTLEFRLLRIAVAGAALVTAGVGGEPVTSFFASIPVSTAPPRALSRFRPAHTFESFPRIVVGRERASIVNQLGGLNQISTL